ncbi:MAG TPA: TolC family protein [Kofleriaceae bacterium]|jgi:outer membrane protein TolC
MRVWFAGVFAIICVAPAARADGPLTFEQAIHLALAHNERSGIAELNVEVAEGDIDKARVAFLPALTAGGTNAWTPWDKRPTDVTKGSLMLSQPLIVPSAFPLYDQAKHNLEGTRAQTVDDKRQLAFDAAKAYLAVLLADQVVQAAQKKLDTAKEEVKATNVQYEAKIVSSNDTTRAQIDLSNSEHELSVDQGNLDAAYVSLGFVIAAKTKGPLVTPLQLLAQSAKPVTNVDQLVAASVKQRPDLEARKQDALAAHDFAREPRYRFFPTLGVAATMNAASTKIPGDGYYLDGSLQFTASWVIFDAGSRNADERTRDAQAAIADLTTDLLGRQVDEQVRTALVQLASAQAALVAARDAMTAAQKSASEEQILYGQGLATALELVDANEQRFLAEVQFAEDQFALANSYLALLQAMGKGPLDLETP